MYNTIDFKDHAILIPQEFLDGELRIGKARSYGAEFLLRKQDGKLTGWISYSYIRTFRKIPVINKGKEYPPPYDKPHNISIVVNYEISRRFDAGINWVYSSPMPVTVPKLGITMEMPGCRVLLYEEAHASPVQLITGLIYH